MTDVYKRLARRLDELPNGYPATDSGVELKILRKIFAPEDAEMVLKLKPVPEPAELIAERLGRPVDAMRATLDSMAEKGQIGSFKRTGQQVYALMPFVIGIYEFQLDRLDAEFAQLVQEYMPMLTKTLGGSAPALARVIPVNVSIDAQHQVLCYEDVHRMIAESRSFVLRECICRKQNALVGYSCAHMLESCLGLSDEQAAFDYFTHAGRIISQQEAFGVLDTAAREGLVHCTYNVQQGHRWICNCCICCCDLLRGLKEIKAPYMIAGSNFVAMIDADSCTACGTCAEDRCPMDALSQANGSYKVLSDRCIGCGVCTVTCPTESITLQRRPPSEQDTPPENIIMWNVQRAASRGQ